MDWENLRHFLAMIDSGSLAGAAKTLRVERTTVSRRIRALEAETGLSLFTRRGRRLELTAAGHDLAAAARPMAEAAIHARRLAAGLKPGMRGRVRISAPPALAAARLVAPLVALGRRYPELEIQLVGEMRHASLSRGEADIAIRLSRPETGDLAISKLGDMAFRLYASADYLQKTPASHWRYIGQGDAADALPQQALLNRIAKGNIAFYSDEIQLQAAAAEAGAGVAALPDFAVGGRAGLVPVPPGKPLLTRQIWSVVHTEQRQQERIGKVIETLRRALRGKAAA
ncbi:MAG: LysR family transcriptional regulator [Paracoccus sp. (in: a-proteobacteria)]